MRTTNKLRADLCRVEIYSIKERKKR